MKSLIISALACSILGCGQSNFTGPMNFGGRLVDVPTLERGRDLYNRYCATCHGYDGKAETAQARQLDPRPRDFTKAEFKRTDKPGALPTDKQLGQIIVNGLPGTGMPAWSQIQGPDLDALIQYLKTFSTRWQTPQATPSENGVKGTMKALPATRTAASFRAADDRAVVASETRSSRGSAAAHPTH